MRRVILEVTEELEPILSMSDSRLVKRMMIDTRRWPWNLSIVCGGIQIKDAETGL
jgi:hypothetical protein